MTVQTNTNSIAYVGNGSTVHFDYDFLILDARHLEVYFGDVLQTSGYVVSGVSSQTGGTNYGWMAASVVLVVVPVLIVYLFLQKNIIRGLTAGAIKG